MLPENYANSTLVKFAPCTLLFCYKIMQIARLISYRYTFCYENVIRRCLADTMWALDLCGESFEVVRADWRLTVKRPGSEIV